MADAEPSLFSVPLHFIRLPPIHDDLVTDTSSAQQETVRECLPHLKGINDPSKSPFDFNEHGIPRLDRRAHIRFLHQSLEEFPAAFVAIDASRPWMVYWALMALYLLGEDVSQYRDRVVQTFAPMQNATGGFGGGHGQYAHLAGTYAAILSLAIVGGETAYALIDRQRMWQWLGRLKQPDGGFRVCEGGEEDVRGAYCALVVISLLDLPHHLPSPLHADDRVLYRFQDGLDDWLAKCQTFEGGISGAPGNEAHGAYAFCAIACLCLMHEQEKALQCLDLPALICWLSSRQYAPEGGFAGRTNKLVDGCYSHWVGGCWPLVQAALDGPRSAQELSADAGVRNLYSREGLTRYILSCCQSQTGGLRDKPSKRADSYHTCYTLAGLSSVQHVHYYVGEDAAHTGLGTPYTWKCARISDLTNSPASGLFDEQDMLKPFHPLFVIAHEAAQKLRAWSEGQGRDWEVDHKA